MTRVEMAGSLIALMTVALWGLTFASTKILLQSFSPLEILVMRFGLGFAALCLAPSPRAPLLSIKTEALFAFGGLTGVTLYFLFENIALLYADASVVGVIVSAAPFFTAALAWLCGQGRKPGLNYMLGFALAMTGITLISGKGALTGLNLLGGGLALLAALSWAAYSVIIRGLSDLGFDTAAITRRVFFYGLLFMLPLIFLDNFHIGLNELLDPINLLNIAFLGLGASALCFASWTFALKCLGAARASAYIYLVPVITIISSAVILHEKIDALIVIGALLTIMGLIISERAPSISRGKSAQEGQSGRPRHM